MTADAVMAPCSVQALAVDEPLAGTAPVARTWVVVEQPGPWGRDAITDSHLPDDARAWLLSAKALGVGVLLARHPDRPERSGIGDRNVWVARSATGGLRLRHDVLPDIDAVARWDAEALAAGTLPALGSATPDPLLLVCTHSGRDQCCALHGRALMTALLATCSDAERSRVWECSHVGGHRFAPVTVTLPSGAVHGRLALSDGADLLARAGTGRVRPDVLRGRSPYPQPLQAAEVAVRIATGTDGADDLDVLLVRDDRAVPVELGWPVPTGPCSLEVRHVDGRAWRVEVAHTRSDASRSESCGAEPAPVDAWRIRDVRPAPAWR